MALLDSSDMSSADGWTQVQTDGTNTFNSSQGGRDSTLFHDKLNANWDTNGAYRTTGQTGATGHTIYWDAYFPDATDFLMELRSSAGIAFSGQSALWFTGTVFKVFGGGANTESATTATWYNCRGVINSDGTVTYSFHVDDGTDQQDIASWTTVDSSIVGSTFNYTTNTIYFATNAFSSLDQYVVDTFNYTDDGVVSASSGTSGSSATKSTRMRRKRFR